ncbi:tandem-95 repeat protein [bacterium]|nr:tandem-95 repeat protein [bacterium]
MFRNILKWSACGIALVLQVAFAQSQTPVNFKIAFIADQGLELESVAVLNLIKDEGAGAVLHAGDFDYDKDPPAWENQINAILGENFPYFACMGEDDEKRYFTIDGYQDRLEARMNRLGIPWDGDLGVQSSFHYHGVFFIQTAPAVEDGEHAEYIRDQLATDNSFWRISTFHKNMKRMQVCGGGNATGWDVYEESRKGGAITTNGQCHTYARTHLMSSMSDQTVASTSDTLVLTKDLPETEEDEGRSFHTIAGLGGRSIHRQEREGDWWASIYSKDQDATYGALFGTFNYNGDPSLAYFYFKNIEGAVIDSFYVHSRVKSGYLLAAKTNGLGSVDLSPAGGVYERDDVVTLTANPAPEWSFAGWSGDLTGTGNPATITLDTDKSVTANFTSPDFILTVTVDGSGTVDQDPPGSLHVWGTRVTLSAIANSSHMFVEWNGDINSTENPLNLVIDSDKNVTATFLPNNPPIVLDDSLIVDEDTILSVPAPGVLANDRDPDGDVLVASAVSRPAHGSLSLSNDGSLTFTPATDFNGLDSFVYSATDIRGSSVTGKVTVTINAVNDPPVTAADDYTVMEDDTLRVIAPGLLDNDRDVDGDSLSASVAVSPSNGSLTLGELGAFTYVPNSNFNGVDSFIYSARDSAGGTATDSVTISVAAVNDAPVAEIDSFSVNEDASLNVERPGVLANDNDVDGEPLTAVLVRDPTNGTLNLYEDGSFAYVPNAAFHGADNFTYIAADNMGGIDTATVTLTIHPVNDPPVAIDDAYTVEEDGSLDIAAPGVLINDGDIDGDSLSASLAHYPENGTIILDTMGSFRYTPNKDFNGDDAFEYRLSDGVGGIDTATVTLIILAVNDPPVAVDDAYQIDEDRTLSIAAPGVMSNDVNVDGDSLSVTEARAPDRGRLTLNQKGSFRYTPDPNFNGVDMFEYTLSVDGENISRATVTVTVHAVNDPPVVIDDAYIVEEDGSLDIAPPGVLANDADIDGDSLRASVANHPDNGTLTLEPTGSFRYTPNKDFNGDDAFKYELSDNNGGLSTAVVTLTVDPVNDPPTTEEDLYQIEEDDTLNVSSPGVLSNDYDVDGDRLTVSVTTEPASGVLSLNEDGAFRYVPNSNFNGADEFEYTVSDGNDTHVSGLVKLIVRPANDEPIPQADDYTVNEDSILEIAAPGVLGNDDDPDGDFLAVSVLRGPLHGSLVLRSVGALTYTPNGEFNGADTFTYSVSDSQGGTAAARVNITVAPVNDPPIAREDLYRIQPGTTLRLAAPGILQNDVDVDGDTLLATLINPPSAGQLSLNPDGSFVYVAEGESRYDDDPGILRVFSYMAYDENGAASHVAQVLIAIGDVETNDEKNTNKAPVARDDVATTHRGRSVNIEVTANDTDADGSIIPSTVIILVPPTHGTAAIERTTGLVTYTPHDGFDGTESFRYTVEDNKGARSNVATVVVTVTPSSNPKIMQLHPTDDAHVKYSKPKNNYGIRSGTRVEADEFATYLKFQVNDVDDSLYSATLRLFVMEGASDGGSTYSVSNNYLDTNQPWNENSLTAGNAPLITGLPVAQFGLAVEDSVIEADVTSAISGDGFYSFAISKTTSDRVEYSTKEGDHPPELVIKTASGSGAVVTDIKNPEADNQSDDQEVGLPKTVVLNPNYPNPFNAETTIQYALPKAVRVELIIYNLKGQEVRKLVDGVQQPGYKKVLWDGKDDRGHDVTSGIYFLRLAVGSRNFSTKLILQK